MMNLIQNVFWLVLVEMMGVEPMCKDIGTYTSTSVVSRIDFTYFVSLLTCVEAASLVSLFLHPQTVESGVVHL
jgi:hypothetical protein